jgi:serine-type D-Ala-D-Ala endopeptidase (penicillin-binding protein 7)
MSLCARRPLWFLFLACTFVLPATMAEAMPLVDTMHPTVLTTTRGRSRAAVRRARHRRIRRPPAGGVYARHAVVIDPSTDEVLYEKSAGATAPIASLSKLMTTMVFLEQNPDLDRQVEVEAEDIRGAGKTHLRTSETLALRDLLHMSLMCSDNAATRVLVRESGIPKEDFLSRMNLKATELGLAQARFVEVTGLDERNVASAVDIARLLRAAAGNPTIQEITTTRSYEFYGRYHSRNRAHAVYNTNRLLYGRYEIRGGKTGFINEAGYCFATWVHTQGRDLIAVVLGAPTAATRFADVIRLVQRTSTANTTQTN